jgi:phosphatidylglycerol lysyltransferase
MRLCKASRVGDNRRLRPPCSFADHEDGVSSSIEGLGLARLSCRRPLSRGLAELGRLSLRRISGMLRRDGATRFDITSPRDSESAVARLLDRFSTLSGQVHALSDDPWQLLWGPGRRAFLPFQEWSSTLIAWRDPVGPAEDAPEIIHSFQAHAAVRGKHAVLLGMGRTIVEMLPKDSFKSVWLGTEPFYDLRAWHTRGKPGEEIRQACNHARKHGGIAREVYPLRDAGIRRGIEDATEAWMRARPERRSRSFLRTAPLESPQYRRYFVVEGDDRVESLLVCSPVSLRGQYLQDIVRRPDALRGSNELAMVTAMAVFQREGLEFVTGGIVPFYDPNLPRCDQRPQDGGLMGRVIGRFDHLFRFSGLQQFRGKFLPSCVVDVYALLWPGILTPGLVRDLCAILWRS